MLCCDARLAWLVPGHATQAHVVCASPTVPIQTLCLMCQGCDGASTVTYVAYEDTQEHDDMLVRDEEFRRLWPHDTTVVYPT